MTSRERLDAALNHRSADRVCVDFCATAVTGIHVSTLSRLRRAVLGDDDFRVKVIEPGQMLGEMDDELRDALGIDVVGITRPTTKFGFTNTGWKEFELFDGTPVLVPEKFNVTVDDNGDLLMHPQGDTTAPPSGRMPRDGFYFDAIIRQLPIDDTHLDPADNLEEFQLLSDEALKHYADLTGHLATQTDCGGLLSLPGTGFGDIALIPAEGILEPRGIRDIEEWYVSIHTRREYIQKVFTGQCEIALENIERLAHVVGDGVQVAFVTGTDFGTQRGLFLSVETYRTLFKPFHKKVNEAIHAKTNWKTFIHSCGSVVELIPDFIDAGFDILNPVQCSAEGMEPEKLKREFGKDIVFWGGGVDTQKALPFGTPREVYDQVRRRVEIFNDGGGFVFNAIHNIQPNTPVKNILAMFHALGGEV